MEYVHTFSSFINEGRSKWQSSGTGLTLDQVRSLPSYQRLSRFGLVDISSELQKARLNFRFRLPLLAMSQHPDAPAVQPPFITLKKVLSRYEKIGHMMIIDVHQRSGRIQVYWGHNVFNNGDKQAYRNASKIKSLGHPIETLDDFDTMFKHIDKYISKKAKLSSDNEHPLRYRDDLTPDQAETIRIDNDVHHSVRTLW